MSDLFRAPPENKLTLQQAFLWILLSILVVCGPAAIGLYYFKGVRFKYSQDSKYNIVAIIQTGPDREPLKTSFLAELLGLSVDRPTNLYHFNVAEAKRKLLECPLIKEVEIRKIKPGTIFLDYNVRHPIAFLGDCTNTAIDQEGSLLPFKPFFAPKKLPEIFLGHGDENLHWGSKPESVRMKLALDILQYLNTSFLTKNTYLQRIDVSKTDDPSYGQREIILIFEDWVETDYTGRPILCCYPIILRMNPTNYAEALKNYQKLKTKLYLKLKSPQINTEQQILSFPVTVIDLRLPELAFIKQN